MHQTKRHAPFLFSWGGVNDKGNSTRLHGKNIISECLVIVARSLMKEPLMIKGNNGDVVLVVVLRRVAAFTLYAYVVGM